MTPGSDPLAPLLAGLRGANPRTDIIAGVTVAAIAIPESLAHAHLAGVRPDVGLYSSMAAAFVYAPPATLELQPGQMSLHDVYMIHGARPNTSARRRTGVALRYMPATSVFERSLRPVDGKSGVAVNFARNAGQAEEVVDWDEIAGILGVTESTVRNHLLQARRALREGLEREYPDLVPRTARQEPSEDDEGRS